MNGAYISSRLDARLLGPGHQRKLPSKHPAILPVPVKKCGSTTVRPQVSQGGDLPLGIPWQSLHTHTQTYTLCAIHRPAYTVQKEKHTIVYSAGNTLLFTLCREHPTSFAGSRRSRGALTTEGAFLLLLLPSLLLPPLLSTPALAAPTPPPPSWPPLVCACAPLPLPAPC
jgi:hypothetical protein